jgi:hypothetical protein
MIHDDMIEFKFEILDHSDTVQNTLINKKNKI